MSGFLKCSCVQCGGHIEFPAEGIGQTIACPHCARSTELGLPTPVSSAERPSRSLKWIVAGVVVLLVGVVGVGGALVMAKRLARKTRGPELPPVVHAKAAPVQPNINPANTAPDQKPAHALDGFSVSEIKIESSPGSTLFYAVGTIKNETDRQRFGVTVELGLFDARDQRLGGARDYKDTIEPRAEWSFRALLTQKNVASARLSSVREQP